MYTNCEESACTFLTNFVAERTNIEDFVIESVERLNDLAYNINVKYSWMLNGWKKNVETTIVVIYRPAAGDFLCSMQV